MRIAVTGASGVVGRGVVPRLLSAGHEVVGLARHQPESWPNEATFVRADIRDEEAVRRAVDGAEVVLHCAWAVDPARGHPEDREVNIGGTQNVLDAIARSGTRRIVFASSAHVYGRGALLAETEPLQPVSTYGVDKASVEGMIAESGAEWVTIRSAVILGRGIDNWVRRALAAAFFPGDAVGRSLQGVHADDAHRVLVRAALDPDIGSGAVNLAAAGEITLGEIAGTFGRPIAPRLFRQLSPHADLDLATGRHPVGGVGEVHLGAGIAGLAAGRIHRAPTGTGGRRRGLVAGRSNRVRVSGGGAGRRP